MMSVSVLQPDGQTAQTAVPEEESGRGPAKRGRAKVQMQNTFSSRCLQCLDTNNSWGKLCELYLTVILHKQQGCLFPAVLVDLRDI